MFVKTDNDPVYNPTIENQKCIPLMICCASCDLFLITTVNIYLWKGELPDNHLLRHQFTIAVQLQEIDPGWQVRVDLNNWVTDA